jgi:hypothetical protein
MGLGVGLGLGIGVGVAADVEPDEALTAPPPQPTAKQIREKNRTQPMIFGPMGNVSCTTATLDADDLLDVGFYGDLAAASSSSVKIRSLCLALRKSKFLCFPLSSVFQKISMPKKAASRLNATYDPSFKIAAHSRGC